MYIHCDECIVYCIYVRTLYMYSVCTVHILHLKCMHGICINSLPIYPLNTSHYLHTNNSFKPTNQPA